MTIIKSSDSKLILKSDPPLKTIVFMAIWVLLYTLIPPLSVFHLIRERGKFNFFCERVEPQIVDCLSQQYPLIPVFNIKNTSYRNVKGATYNVQRTTSMKGRVTYRYSVFLQTDRGSLKAYKGSSSSSNSLANRINNFLASKQPEFIFSQPPSPTVAIEILFICLFPVIGVFTLHFLVRWETIVLDKNRDEFVWICYSILGKRSATFKLREIKGINIRSYSRKGRQYYNSKILAGKKEYKILTTTRQDEAEERAKLVKSFLTID